MNNQEWDIFSSECCEGEKCSVCGEPAQAKIGEEIMPDDPHKNRHNYTNYVCAEHFDMVIRPYKYKKKVNTILEDIDFELSFLEDVLHGSEGDKVTKLRYLIQSFYDKNG